MTPPSPTRTVIKPPKYLNTYILVACIICSFFDFGESKPTTNKLIELSQAWHGQALIENVGFIGKRRKLQAFNMKQNANLTVYIVRISRYCNEPVIRENVVLHNECTKSLLYVRNATNILNQRINAFYKWKNPIYESTEKPNTIFSKWNVSMPKEHKQGLTGNCKFGIV